MRALVPTAAVAVAVSCLFSCGRPPENVRDVRVPIPAKNDALIDFVTPEVTIMPGEDKMLCATLTYDGETTAFTKVESLQGKFGHHVVLLAQKADDTRGPGEVYDCSKMTNFEPFAIPLNAVPAGYGTSLTAGKKLIIQFHYLNAGETPLLVRDVIRLTKMPVANVTKWTSVYATNEVGFKVPPRATDFKATFDCELPQDVELIAFGGHMHEWGSKFKADLVDGAGAATELYSVGSWKADYRDSPPINLYQSAPKPLTKGTILRTTCEWNNTTDRELSFPEEMCATFGFVAGVKDPVVCTVGMTQ
jgi:hypothetical protein